MTIETLEGLLKHNGPVKDFETVNRLIGLKSFKNNYFGFSKEIVVKEYGRYKQNIVLNESNFIGGSVYTMDKKTPHPGINVQLVDALNGEI